MWPWLHFFPIYIFVLNYKSELKFWEGNWSKIQTTHAKVLVWGIIRANCLDLSLYHVEISNPNSHDAENVAPFSHSSTNGHLSLAWVNEGLLQASVSACETVKQRMCLQIS